MTTNCIGEIGSITENVLFYLMIVANVVFAFYWIKAFFS